MKDVTLILQRIEQGQSQATEDLFPVVYNELRRIAAGKMNVERMDHTLSSTALVHEAYVRLVDTETVRHWGSRGHFFSAAAEAMRRILVEHARRKLALKRGGDKQSHEVLEDLATLPNDPSLMLDLDAAIDRLAEADTHAAELLKLLLYAGLSVAEGGRTLGMSRKVAYRHWEYIRSWFSVHFDPHAS